MAQVQVSLFIYLTVGYVASRRGVLSKETRIGITNLLVDILMPCMVFNSFHEDMGLEQLKTASAALIAAFALSFFAWFVGWVLFRHYPQAKAGVLRYGTLVANSGFAGLPVIQSAYGAPGLLIAAVFIIPNRILMWSAGVSMFRQGEKCHWVRNVLLNPGIIAIALGLTRSLLHIPIPGFLNTAIASMGNCTTAISFFVVGSILADVDYRTVFNRDALLLAVVRLLFLPACALIVLKAIEMNALSTAVAVVLTGMPIGSTTAILGEKYGGDAGFASQCVFVTTLFSLVTIPVLTIFL